MASKSIRLRKEVNFVWSLHDPTLDKFEAPRPFLYLDNCTQPFEEYTTEVMLVLLLLVVVAIPSSGEGMINEC